MPVNLITHNAEFFSLPSDFLPIPTQIVNSIKGNYVDYCYSETMLREVIKKAKEQKVSLVYEKVLDKYGDLDYIIISRGHFFNTLTNEKVKEPMQLDKKNLPFGIIIRQNAPKAYNDGLPKKPKGVTKSTKNKSQWKNFFEGKTGIITI